MRAAHRAGTWNSIESTAVNPETQSKLPMLLGLGGLFESGKDTAADHLVETRGFAKVGMSEPIDAALYALNPIVRASAGPPAGVERYRGIRDAVGYTEAKRIPEVRALLQRMGVEVGRKIFGDGVWVGIAARSIQKLRAAGIPVCVSGIRFPGEQSMITGIGGTLVWVDRPGHVPAGSVTSRGDVTEVSIGASSFGFVLVNNGSVADLRTAAGRMVDLLGGRTAR